MMKNKGNFRKWMQLLMYFILIWGGILFFSEFARRIPVIAQALEIIDEKGIETDALFYTESEYTTTSAAKINAQIP